MTTKILIAGSRDFADYELLESTMNQLLLAYDGNVEIVSGTARGADKLGEQYAKDNGYALKQFLANWSLYGRSAGYVRNAQMADYINMAVIFWDGQSRGTKHMIELCRQKAIKLKVVLYAD